MGAVSTLENGQVTIFKGLVPALAEAVAALDTYAAAALSGARALLAGEVHDGDTVRVDIAEDKSGLQVQQFSME